MSSDWLTHLAPDHPPPPPGWWPPALGWWAVLGLSLFFLTLALLWWRRRNDPFQSSRSAALREIRHIEEEAYVDESAAARAIQSVMRRYAIAVFGTERVASLTGESWLSFIGEQQGGSRLSGAAGRSLLAAAFANQYWGQREDWLIGAREFIRGAARGDHTGI